MLNRFVGSRAASAVVRSVFVRTSRSATQPARRTGLRQLPRAVTSLTVDHIADKWWRSTGSDRTVERIERVGKAGADDERRNGGGDRSRRECRSLIAELAADRAADAAGLQHHHPIVDSFEQVVIRPDPAELLSIRRCRTASRRPITAATASFYPSREPR